MGSLPHGPFSHNQVEPPYYPSQSHEAARKAALLCLGDGEKGFILAGPAGVGKTTVLREILKTQAIHSEVLFIHSALPLTRRELIQSLLYDCHLPMEGEDVELHLRLTNHLASVLGSGQSIWIVLDDAEVLDNPAFMEVVGLTRLPGLSGARLQVLLTGASTPWESSGQPEIFPKIEVAPWTALELADWIRQRIGATTGNPMPGPGRELMELLAPGGKGVPGQVLAVLRSAWRLAGDPDVVYPRPEVLKCALQKVFAEVKSMAWPKESRRPLENNDELLAKVVIPSQPEMDFEGMEEWMAGASTSAFSWEQGG